MKKQDFINVGVVEEYIPKAIEAVKSAGKAGRLKGIKARKLVKDITTEPQLFVNDEHFGELARLLLQPKEEFVAPDPINFSRWGFDIDEQSIKQMETACRVPVASAAALMPDAHLGYGLPIGGVLATYNSVIPYAVGVDIACRMKLTVIDTPVKELEKELRGGFRRGDRLSESITSGTRFGVGAEWKPRCNHAVMDKDWNVSPVTKAMKDRAWTQLGTSGSGNHFVEIGVLTLTSPDMNLTTGTYLAILSHSGSRGAGANVCNYYKDIAIQKLDKSYKEYFKNLAWLSLDSDAGQEYWAAMNLMGEYASANHAVIHDNIVSILGAEVLATVENHHNFAWREIHNGKELIVHRKGATPAGEGILGIIPGSMADPCFVIRGKGKAESLNSASHGAGRRMSRNEARKKFNWNDWKSILKQRGVRLLSAGLDEVPGAYKDINAVMAAQSDLVDIIARFDPRIVKMSDDGRSED